MLGEVETSESGTTRRYGELPLRVNCGRIRGCDPNAPFGGIKDSGIGPSGDHWGSKPDVEKFLEVKYLCMSGVDR
jgi:acyl-CoA reductase-like NAD-dependent aldehyde dehydrogenase